ncbi:undecaprenyldiphospho-muramoylpentapeptide beta-N-acetylglucosaminyltransferase [Aliidiomarina quisquiliarum]|uniref:undecaprenyldiphospho-muramoylpentapeptide beta-N-acetylglucosaminyltransferase n=1 Tax=Aliidiomarina quisquiliarum TaxID=2938947 RepID=UPI00208E226F|nr:undecaprenyldiphospho-muramoylpentapeptide beta-N-acetylglucosaminyltransferase [Aliidiomarina quisquiliarum]MCO4321463.1 undecaprenyldiphospho-muramoylpentapeptide beta-N-acetylglucosaminyltransferase [Aliidiomarina quisquiliarum]
MKHVLITAGGTGGHVFPALAVAQLMRQQGWLVSWLGTADRMEAHLVPAAGFDFTGVAQQGVRGRGIKGWIIAPFRLVRSVFKMRSFLANKKPDLVLGFGGYTAGPAGIAAWTKRIPLVIHEQNAVAGLTNKLLARFANKVLVGFAAAKQQLPASEYVGNPVRSDITALAEVAVVTPVAPFKLLVVGGSLGAEHLNQVVPAAVATLAPLAIEVWHQTGRGKQAEVIAAYGNHAGVRVTEFIDDMAQAYAQADLIVCRAGALTCSEIACVGRASILVPYPYAVDNHQLQNANALAAVGAAQVIEQHNLTANRLQAELQRLFSAPHLLAQMAHNARQAAVSNAGQTVVNICNELINGKPQE